MNCFEEVAVIRLHPCKDHKEVQAEQLAQAVAATLRYVRDRRALSQELLARLAKIDRSGYAKLERGERKVSLFHIFRIAAALECPAATLVKAIEAELRQSAWENLQGFEPERR